MGSTARSVGAMILKATIICAIGGAMLAVPVVTEAHELNSSYATVQVRGDTVAINFAIESADITSGFDVVPSIGTKAGPEELMAQGQEVSDYVTANSRIEADGDAVAWPKPRMRTSRDREGNHFLRLLYVIGFSYNVAELELTIDLSERFADDHKTLVSLFAEEKPPQQAIFSKQEPQRLFVVGEHVSLWANAVQFTKLGIEHIFIGYDHIMFLLALIIIGGRLLSTVKIVSSFTVAHSITLVLATLEVVQLPGRWIEVGIAFSIAYVALENFWLKRADLRWVVTFVFGLVHGFGFANVLRELGLPAKGLVVSLVTFNIGVEIGQICIVAILFPLILWVSTRHYQRAVVSIVSAVIFLFGIGWLVERIFELEYMPI